DRSDGGSLRAIDLREAVVARGLAALEVRSDICCLPRRVDRDAQPGNLRAPALVVEPGEPLAIVNAFDEDDGHARSAWRRPCRFDGVPEVADRHRADAGGAKLLRDRRARRTAGRRVDDDLRGQQPARGLPGAVVDARGIDMAPEERERLGIELFHVRLW